ncbi:MAG: diguanylate cyclase [Pseudomonadota bacterium]
MAMPEMGWPGVITGMFMGFLILPVFYNVGLYAVLRDRLIAWHSVRVTCIALAVIALSPLSIGTVFAVDSLARVILFYLFFHLAVACSGIFLESYIERDIFSRGMSRALRWSGAAIMLVAPISLLEFSNPALALLRSVVLFGVLAILVSAMVRAVRRGSQAVWFQIAAWSGIILVCAVSLTINIITQAANPNFLAWLSIALMMEVALTAAGVAWRFLRLKKERDEARLNEAILDKAAHTDPLTGLANRRGLIAHTREGVIHGFDALAIFDLDHFKSVNDDLGHDVGDRVLQAAATALMDDRGPGELLAVRLGGEEFALLVAGADPEARIEAIRNAIPVHAAGVVLPYRRQVTASAGLIHLEGGETLSDAMRIADRRLYAAKMAGRNRMIVADVDIDEDGTSDERVSAAA